MAVYQSLTLTELSQDIENNTSQLHLLWQSTQTGSSYNHIANPATYWVTINADTELSQTASCILPWRDTGTLADVVITVPHDEKGNATVTVRTWMNTKLSAGVVELSKTLVLTPIPRASTIFASDGVIGGSSRIAVGKKHPDFTHSIAYSFGDLSGYLTDAGALSDTEVVMAKDSIDFALPWHFHYAVTDRTEAVCTLTCRTYSEGVQIGEPQTGSFAIRVDEEVCFPQVSGTVEDVCDATLALTGDSQVLIQGASHGLCSIFSETKMGATLVKRQIGGTELAQEENQLILYGPESAVQFSVTDSRGYTAVFTPENRMIPYFRPTVRAQLSRNHPTDGTATLTLGGEWFSGSFGAVQNSLTAYYQVDAGEKQPILLTCTDGAYSAVVALTDMDYTKVYSVQVTVSDALTELGKRLTLKKSIPVFDWGENDFCFHVPVSIEGSLTVGGKALLDIVYPVGTVYTCAYEHDPSEFLGGVWTAMASDSEYKWLRIS